MYPFFSTKLDGFPVLQFDEEFITCEILDLILELIYKGKVEYQQNQYDDLIAAVKFFELETILSPSNDESFARGFAPLMNSSAFDQLIVRPTDDETNKVNKLVESLSFKEFLATPKPRRCRAMTERNRDDESVVKKRQVSFKTTPLFDQPGSSKAPIIDQENVLQISNMRSILKRRAAISAQLCIKD